MEIIVIPTSDTQTVGARATIDGDTPLRPTAEVNKKSLIINL